MDRLLALPLPLAAGGEGANAQDVGVAAEHAGRLVDVLGGTPVHDDFVTKLKRPHARAGLEVQECSPELGAGDMHGLAGAQGGIEEHAGEGAAGEGAQPCDLALIAPNGTCEADQGQAAFAPGLKTCQEMREPV
jgi:hypothetical protein